MSTEAKLSPRREEIGRSWRLAEATPALHTDDHGEPMDTWCGAYYRDVEWLLQQFDSWRASYNDLVGRIPRHTLDAINRGGMPHVCEFRAEFDALKTRAEKAEATIREQHKALDDMYQGARL